MEIERKWIVREVPNVMFESRYDEEQFYVSATDEEEYRMRKSTLTSGVNRHVEPYLKTHKVGNGLCREEYESAVGEHEYEHFRNLCILEGNTPITKDWYCFNVNNHLIEFSIVDGGTFIYAEVEFNSVEEAEQYKFPWQNLIIKEVTDDSRFSMKNYWRNGYIPLDV